MENYKEQLQNYLKTIEEFLTSVLLEETDITISDFEPKEAEAYFAEQNKDDINYEKMSSNLSSPSPPSRKELTLPRLSKVSLPSSPLKLILPPFQLPK